MNERERMVVIVGGLVLSLAVTGVIAWLAIVATDAGERNLLIGGLIGTGAFGGGALFGLLGAHRPAGQPSQTTVNAEPPSTVTVENRSEGQERP